MERYIGGKFPHNGGHSPVLDDEGVDPGRAGGADALPQGGQLMVKDDGVEGLVDLHPEAVGVTDSPSQLLRVEVAGIRPGGKAFLSEVDGVCAAADCGLERLHRAGGSQNFRPAAHAFPSERLSSSFLRPSFSFLSRVSSRWSWSASMRALAESST